MPVAPLEILYEDNHLLAINKPAGLPTMGVAADAPSIVRLAKQYLKERYHKPGNVYLGVVSRLDSLASGVLLLARTSKAAARLTEQFRTRAVRKTYWAIVSGAVPPADQLVDWVRKDETRQRMIVASANAEGAKLARLAYRRLAVFSGGSLLEIELETGRKHQIRLQFASRGLPILGDRKYGSSKPFTGGRSMSAIALHARRLGLDHPTSHQALELIAPLPPLWRQFGIEL